MAAVEPLEKSFGPAPGFPRRKAQRLQSQQLNRRDHCNNDSANAHFCVVVLFDAHVRFVCVANQFGLAYMALQQRLEPLFIVPICSRHQKRNMLSG